MTAQLFPLSIARGDAFCNRTKERIKLRELIKAGHHIWLQALRRHGKSSLLLKVQDDFIEDKELVSLHRTDLAFKTDDDEIITALCQGALSLLANMITSAEDTNKDNSFQKIGNYISKTFANFAPSFQIERGMPTISFTAKTSLTMLEKTLLILDKEAKSRNFRVVYVIDEFQQVGKTARNEKNQRNTSIEGTIRHCLELATHTNYIFCGSEHTLMQQVMEDTSRPLYNHTMKINLGRIDEDCYKTHLNELWNNKWDENMPDHEFQQIVELTQLHPYYVNNLCATLWLKRTKPTDADILDAWLDIVEQDGSDYKAIALKLTKNELRILKALANHPTSTPTSGEFTKKHTVPIGSVMGTIERLINKDLVYTSKDTYMIVNPVLAYMARVA